MSDIPGDRKSESESQPVSRFLIYAGAVATLAVAVAVTGIVLRLRDVQSETARHREEIRVLTQRVNRLEKAALADQQRRASQDEFPIRSQLNALALAVSELREEHYGPSPSEDESDSSGK